MNQKEREREKKRERETETETDTDRERERDLYNFLVWLLSICIVRYSIVVAKKMWGRLWKAIKYLMFAEMLQMVKQLFFFIRDFFSMEIGSFSQSQGE